MGCADYLFDDDGTERPTGQREHGEGDELGSIAEREESLLPPLRPGDVLTFILGHLWFGLVAGLLYALLHSGLSPSAAV
jgi:hypothetical protein